MCFKTDFIQIRGITSDLTYQFGMYSSGNRIILLSILGMCWWRYYCGNLFLDDIAKFDLCYFFLIKLIHNSGVKSCPNSMNHLTWITMTHKLNTNNSGFIATRLLGKESVGFTNNFKFRFATNLHVLRTSQNKSLFFSVMAMWHTYLANIYIKFWIIVERVVL